MQYCEAYEARFGGIEVKTDKVKKEETKKKGTWYLTLQWSNLFPLIVVQN